jgi:hypothetical protein
LSRPDAEFNVLVLSLLFGVVSGWGLLHGIFSTVALAALCFPAGTVIQEGMFNLYFGKKSPISCDKESKNPLPLKKRRQFVIDSNSD